MNDNELSTMVRESVADVHSTAPVAQIVSRGRELRARRRIPGVAAALVVAAGTALAVSTLVPSGHPGPAGSGHPGGHPASARLAAWTVARQANGDIDVTIRELRDPAGLQAKLRADGIPAAVHTGLSGPPPGCKPYPVNPPLLEAIVQLHPGQTSSLLVIDPSAIPPGVGLGITDFPLRVRGIGKHPAGALPRSGVGAGVSLVYASQQCTGT
jgi:hypothetical protein